MKSKIIPQFEFPWESEAFTLVVEQTIDGDRVKKERKESLNNQQESDSLQEALL